MIGFDWTAFAYGLLASPVIIMFCGVVGYGIYLLLTEPASL